MKIFVSEKEIDNNNLNYVEDDFVEEYWLLRGSKEEDGFEVHDDVGLCEVISLEQHEEEIRKQERQEVIAELEEWANTCYLVESIYEGVYCIDKDDLKQKLNEMKGEK